MPPDCASKLIPILREGVEIVKMVSFKTLKTQAAAHHAERDAAFHGRLAGAMVNKIFGPAGQTQETTTDMGGADDDLLAGELARLTDRQDLCILLTDALRMQALCDYQEGCDSSATLEQAVDLGILLTERDLPLPHTFLALVRRLGIAHGLLRRNQSRGQPTKVK